MLLTHLVPFTSFSRLGLACLTVTLGCAQVLDIQDWEQSSTGQGGKGSATGIQTSAMSSSAGTGDTGPLAASANVVEAADVGANTTGVDGVGTGTGSSTTGVGGGTGGTGGSGAASGAASCLADCELAGVGRCEGETCVIDCWDFSVPPPACYSKVICPTDLSCEIWVEGKAPLGVDCLSARSCDVKCNIGCSAPVECAGDWCTVTCSSSDTCQGSIACRASKCSVTCEEATSCSGAVSCEGMTCSIDCQQPGGQLGSCSGGTCCTAGTCTLTGTQNACP